MKVAVKMVVITGRGEMIDRRIKRGGNTAMSLPVTQIAMQKITEKGDETIMGNRILRNIQRKM